MDPSWYRLRFFLDVIRLISPSLFLLLALRLAHIKLNILFAVPCHIAAVIIVFVARVQLATWGQARDARARGVQEIPRVVSKWPGNIDLLLHMLRAGKTSYIQQVYLALFEEYQCTTLNTRILWMDQVITMDSQHMKFILATGFEHFWRGKAQKERFAKFVGNGIFNRDDEMWKMHRSMARPFFAWDRISDFEQFEKYSAHAISILTAFAESGRPCDIQDLHTRFSLDSSAEFLLGQELNTLSAALPSAGAESFGAKGSETHDKWGEFVRAFDLCQDISTRRAKIGKIWPLFELFEDTMEKPAKTIKDGLEPLVEAALREKADSKQGRRKDSMEQKTFLQHLVESTEDVGLIRDQLLSIIIASRDTTACLLSFVVYFLAMHPEIMERLRAEVLDVCGSTGTPDADSIRQMRYMRAVLNETLRIFPAVPLNVRESRAASCVFPAGDPTFANATPLYVPGGTPLMYFPLLMQRNPTLWGPDAEHFNPERWLDPQRLARYTANPLMFQPFSAGPRICIGQNYAYNQASFFLVRLLQRFDGVRLAPDAQPRESLPPAEWKTGRGRQCVEQIWPAAAMTLFVKGGLWVRFTPARV
ncbi:cytochrome P450 monooxygenase CYP63 [Dentipellis sp. KUC8613]|nr:cytochrome P450 monooxygenase CYP63 [Dentipellis sp. KUC8613]